MERSQDAFDLLGMPARFDLDEAELRRAWLARSAALHPDRAPDDAEAGAAMARVNEAMRVLKDPERRAAALLARLGAGQDKDADDKALPEGFLLEILEVRQELEEAQASGDAAALAAFERWAAERRQGHIEEVGRLFTGLDEMPPGECGQDARVTLIRRELNAWRYIERMREQMK